MRLLRLCGQRRENELQRSVAAHRETGFDICGSAQLLWWGGGRRVKQRDSSELWGEGCDHSVTENYCHNGYIHTRTGTHNGKCVQTHRSGNADVWYIVAAPVQSNAHLHVHLYTGDGSPLRWSPVGTAIFCTSTCHLDHAHGIRRAHLHTLCSLPLVLSSPPLALFIPRCVKPASYDNSAPRDMLTLLVESASDSASQLSFQKLGPGCESDKKKCLNSVFLSIWFDKKTKIMMIHLENTVGIP